MIIFYFNNSVYFFTFGLIYSMVQIVLWFVSVAGTCAIFEYEAKGTVPAEKAEENTSTYLR